MKILIISDIHGKYEILSQNLNTFKALDPDLIICPGDLTEDFNTPSESVQMGIAKSVIENLLSIGKPLLCIPGNNDYPNIIKLFDQHNTNLHNKLRDFNGVKFIGFGGAQTPFNTRFEPTEEETKDALETLGSQVEDNFVLVVHAPPRDTRLDMIQSGIHTGSQSIRDFILERKPILTISGHIHETRGTDKLGSTVLFSPGPLFRGKFGVVALQEGAVECRLLEV